MKDHASVGMIQWRKSEGATVKSARVKREPQESRASLLHLARVRNGPMHRAYGHAAADLSLICKSVGSIRHLSSYCPLAVTDLLPPSTSSPLQSTPIFLSLWLMLFTIRNPHLLVAHLLQLDALRLWSCTVLFLPPFSNAGKLSVPPSGIQDFH